MSDLRANAQPEDRKISKNYYIGKKGARAGTLLPTLENISLEVSAGEFVTLIGPSGCGPTTLVQLGQRSGKTGLRQSLAER